MQRGNHCCFSDARNQALIDRRSRCDPQRMTVQTSFAKKVVRFQNTYDCFLAPLGNDGKLDLALLDVKNRVRRIALPEHNFILSIIVNGSTAIYLREKHFGIERELYFAFHLQALLIARDTPHAPRSYEASREGNVRHT